MTKTERMAQVMTAMKSFDKVNYHKAEVLPELFALQQEMVDQVFADEVGDTSRLKIWDVENRLAEKNEALGHVADETLERFRESSKAVSNLIRSEISGSRGEMQAFGRLDKITGVHKLLRNVELSSETRRTELDGIVLTRKGAFIIEVKNTRKNILIDEEGNYYRMGEYTNWDCNIGEKMSMREALLGELLRRHGYEDCKITSIVVFTNRQVEVRNKLKTLKVSFLGPLPYIIDEFEGEDVYSSAELEAMAAAIEEERCNEEYAIDVDINQYKQEFAAVVAQLDEAQAMTDRKEARRKASIMDVLMRIFSPARVEEAA